MSAVNKLFTPFILLVSLQATAAGLDTVEQKASYSYGIDIIKNLKKQGIVLDLPAFTRGLQAGDKGGDYALTQQEMNAAKAQYQLKAREKLVAEQARIGKKNKAAGDAFLAANKSKPGVITTGSGLQYKILKPGNGKTPAANDTVVTHYRGTLIDGREFDSSYSRNQPATFPVKGVIKGWTEALQLMKEGGKWELYIPSELAYGKSKRSELIQPNSTLVFEIELLEVK
jgi:FKBP-type peptidyl-prolyl cis-trans isomerase FklB